MNNNDDYLWDRSGQPDPEIQQLEEILGALRYEPRPLEIPAEVKVERPHSLFRGLAPRLAIAATIALLLLGVGVWLGMRRFGFHQPAVAGVPKSPAPSGPSAPPVPSSTATVKNSPAPERKDIEPQQEPKLQPQLAGYSNRRRNSTRSALQNRLLAAKREKEGEAAKDQLMLALRLVSAKLNYVQKKAQSPNSQDPVHNQHKIG
jgi:hypothetical protein